MYLRRKQALGGPRRILHLSYRRIVAFEECEAAVTIQKIIRGFLVRVLLSDHYIEI